jgi:hypothetical protein
MSTQQNNVTAFYSDSSAFDESDLNITNHIELYSNHAIDTDLNDNDLTSNFSFQIDIFA